MDYVTGLLHLFLVFLYKYVICWSFFFLQSQFLPIIVNIYIGWKRNTHQYIYNDTIIHLTIIVLSFLYNNNFSQITIIIGTPPV